MARFGGRRAALPTSLAGTSLTEHVCGGAPLPDLDNVVTEHGIADLRGADDGERCSKLIEVAAPEHRAELLNASTYG